MTTDMFIKMLEAVGIDTAQLKVFFYLIEHVNDETSCLTASYDKIAKQAGVSYSTVAKAIRRFKDMGIIEDAGPSCWRLLGSIDMYEADEHPENEEELGLPLYVRHYVD